MNLSLCLQVPVLEAQGAKIGSDPDPAPVLSWAAFRELCEAPPLQVRRGRVSTLAARLCVGLLVNGALWLRHLNLHAATDSVSTLCLNPTGSQPGARAAHVRAAGAG